MNSTPSYRGHRFPPEAISHAVRLYHRVCLSLRDVEDPLTERGITVSYETIASGLGGLVRREGHILRWQPDAFHLRGRAIVP